MRLPAWLVLAVALAVVVAVQVTTATDRDDRFVAAVDLNKQNPRFRLAYLARAVTVGEFAAPGATVEDLQRPHVSARLAGSRLRVLAE